MNRASARVLLLFKALCHLHLQEKALRHVRIHGLLGCCAV